MNTWTIISIITLLVFAFSWLLKVILENNMGYEKVLIAIKCVFHISWVFLPIAIAFSLIG